jgi:hypothetical protein
MKVIFYSSCLHTAAARESTTNPPGGRPQAALCVSGRLRGHVIATLRTVGHEGAAEVVRAYYAQPEDLRPAERLAAAQRALIARLPVDTWAAFTVWGDAACGS